VRIALCLAAVLSACQCQSNSTTSGAASGSGSGNGSSVGSNPGSASATRTTLEIKLPALSGKPPVKTTSPITPAQLKQLAALTFDEFSLEATEYPVSVAIRQRAQLRPKISINILIAPCNETNFKCLPMTLDAWRGDQAKLEEKMVNADLLKRRDTIFELGASSIAGVPLIYTYQAGQSFGQDETGQSTGTYSLAYALHYNDGVNMLRVIVTFSDDPRPTLAEMRRAMPRDFMEKAAAAFLDAYGQAWGH